MTRPVYEPTASRWSAALDYGSQQLFRRPAPDSGTGEWAYLWRTVDKTYTSGTPDNPFNASTTGAQSDSAVLEAFTASELIEVKETGIYLATFAGQWTVSFAGEKFARIAYAVNNIVAPDFADQIYSESGAQFNVCASVIVVSISAGTPPGVNWINPVLSQTSGIDRDMSEAMLHVVRIAAFP